MKESPHVHSTVEVEYSALTEGTGLIDRSNVGRLHVSGEDALDLLNRLSTNELMTLKVGTGAPTVLTTNKGRIVDLLYAYRHEDRLFVTTSPGNQQKVAEWIDFYTFVEDVVVEDVTDRTKMLSVVGPGSAEVLDRLTNGRVSALTLYASIDTEIAGTLATFHRTDFLTFPSFDLTVALEDYDHLSWTLTNEGAVPIGTHAVEALRIEQGIPEFGKELTESYNPHEANLVDHLSFTKGCYIGQEVIARLQTYQKVQKYLVGLRWDKGDVSPGTRLVGDGKQVGVVTSVSRSPISGEGIGLGYVRKELAVNDKPLTTEGAVYLSVKNLA